MHGKSLQSCPTLGDPLDCSPPGSSVRGDFPGKNTGVDCHSLLQGIFMTQRSTREAHACIYAHTYMYVYIYVCITCILYIHGASLVAQTVKNPPAMWETWVQPLKWEDLLEEEMATQVSILPWRIPHGQKSLVG